MRLECCKCGIAIPDKIGLAVDMEFERREMESPIVGLLCKECFEEMMHGPAPSI